LLWNVLEFRGMAMRATSTGLIQTLR